MATEPIQCLGNAWEKDWLDDHGGDHDAYPREDRVAQSQIIRTYYQDLGVTVFLVRFQEHDDRAVCLACSCSAGYTLYLLVRDGDVETMRQQGYRPAG